MEGRKKVGSSSSSFTSELFGSKDSPSPSSGYFASIFPPPSKVQGRESLRPAGAKSQHSPNEPWNTKPGASGNSSIGHEGGNENIRDENYLDQEQRVQPCHLSSSIYYGGQDVFSSPQSRQGSELNSVYKKDGGEDDSGSASRGNWWKGSLYY
ncbi:Salt Induced Serine rich [Hibiscus trionum]|uniref:Salt Induced Serine rich n=1 Tax=Hibiscus trionum TaxID=183268 RepID=A0A9W7IJX9_HIBTR|nr:Salt Induced Serine rich [Hibiscus trionum]